MRGALRRTLRRGADTLSLASPRPASAPLAAFATRSRAAELAKAVEARAARRRREAALGGSLVERSPHAPPPPSPPADAPPAEVVSSLPALTHAALVVQREVEWGTVLLGFEQANKYTIRNADGELVGYLAEEDTSVATGLMRQLARGRRAFVATLLSPAGDVILRVRRPFVLINSSMTVEGPGGEVLGEIQQRFHLWRRHYDLFIGKTQFARVRAGLLSWEFTVEGEKGEELARIDRNFVGLAKELFTDAGAYVVHFGAPMEGEGLEEAVHETPSSSSSFSSSSSTAAAPASPPLPGADAAAGGGSLVASGTDAWQPAVAPGRPLRLSERAAVLALAICVDADYFSRHSSSPGILPIGGGMGMGMPIPIPFPGGGGGGGEAAEEAAGGGGDMPLPDRAAEGGGDGGGGAAASRDWRDREVLDGEDEFKPDTSAPRWGDPPPAEEEEDSGGGSDGEGGSGGGWGVLRGLLGGGDDDEEE